MRWSALAIAIVVLCGSSIVAPAEPFDDGLRAYQNKQFETALRVWSELAEQGDARAQYAIGTIYRTGRGVAQDYAEALKWYRKAADQGYARAQTALAWMYRNGQGVAKDSSEALSWYRKAAEQGDAEAQTSLGWVYENGDGVSKDVGAAREWYRRAGEAARKNPRDPFSDPAMVESARPDSGKLLLKLEPDSGKFVQRLEPDYFAAMMKRQIAEAARGLVAFNPPSEMKVGTTERITVRIARDLAEDTIKKGLRGRGAVEIEQIEVGTFMRARLFGDGFEITTRSDEGQVVLENRFAEWLFDVLPVESGRKTLSLHIALRLKLPSTEETIDLPVLARNIAVQVDPWWTAKRVATTNWQWIVGGVGTIMMAVGGFFGRRWLERRDAKRVAQDS